MNAESRRLILFVDDQPEVLGGLKRTLWAERSEWDLLFSKSCDEAVKVLEDCTVDVVITDLQMPRADGVQLLEYLRSKHPDCVRIILSGSTAPEMVLRSVGLAHQFLAKPCTPESLKATIQRALFVKNLLDSNPGLQALVGRIRTLPAVPSLHMQVARELQNEEPSLQRVGEIISQDPGMAAKILQLVNSAFFGLPKQIDDVTRAVCLLGLDVTRALVLSVEIFSQFEEAGLGGVAGTALWHHSLACAQLARRLAEQEWPRNRELHERAYTTGLLHDIGKLILGAYDPNEYRIVVAQAKTERISINAAEERRWGTGHPAIGAFLLGLWGLPLDLVETIRWHHDPESAPDKEGRDLILLVHASDALAAEFGYQSGNPVAVVSEVFPAQEDGTQAELQINRWRKFAKELFEVSTADGEKALAEDQRS
ncbi:MAG: response regulator [Acidobacteriota bacterium]